MARSIPFGTIPVAEQPLRALLATALLTTFVATAVAQNGIGTTAPALAHAYTGPAATAPAVVESVPRGRAFRTFCRQC